MKAPSRSPWLAVLTGIVGLAIGYSVVVSQDNAVLAGSLRCNNHEKILNHPS